MNRPLTATERKRGIQQQREEWRSENAIVDHPIPADWPLSHVFYVAAVVSNPRPPGDPTWEMLARNWLAAEGLAAITPCGVRRERKTNRNGKRMRTYAFTPYLLFPGYVIVGTGPDRPRLNVAYRCKYLTGFLGQHGVATRVAITELQLLIDSQKKGRYDESKGCTEDGTLPQPGEIVDILDGPFDGFPMMVTGSKAKKSGDDKVFGEIDILGQKTPAIIPLDFLRRREP